MPKVDSSFATRVILILLACAILIILIVAYNNRTKQTAGVEKYDAAPSAAAAPSAPSAVASAPSSATPQPVNINKVSPSESQNNEDFKAVDFQTTTPSPNDCFPRDKNTLEDLLPKDAANSTWAQVNPAGQGDVKDQNFLNAGFHMGINTVGQTLRNPNYQLRSEPANPKLNISPWNQSTIEYDSSRRVFEVGDC
jgi:hypothetical protein